MDDPYDLERFVDAQDQYGEYARAASELRNGRKTSHWMWYVFPQMRGLGQSQQSHKYGITSLAEARAYLQHPVLGPRLLECTQLLLSVEGHSAVQILGSVDAMKLRSCMTLFSRAAPEESAFRQVLDTYFQGLEDEKTVRLLDGDGTG
jgi:uncharacterized protein (DUF1810 family)